MPFLSSSLQNFELDQLEAIAALWGLGPLEKSKSAILLELELEIPQANKFNPQYERLPEPAQQALLALKANKGRILWSTFSQLYGEIRPLGIKQREIEQPWSFPQSVSEKLWYLGCLGRDFLRIDGDLQEMAYLPDEIIPLLPFPPDQSVQISLIPLFGIQSEGLLEANSAILDEIGILLAAWRFEKPQAYLKKTNISEAKAGLLEAFLKAIGLADENLQATEPARKFLELPRGQALAWLAEQWLKAKDFHEVRHIPGLGIETEDEIRSQSARQSVFDFLSRLEAEQWYRLDDLVTLIKANKPDFLREQEEYFSWTIISKPALPEEALPPFDLFESVKEVETFHGFESWTQLEGKLISYILAVMLPLFGLTDLALSLDENKQVLFRLKPIFFLFESSPEQLVSEIENEPIQLSSTGKITMTNRSQRLVRYQIARFAQWLEVSAESGTYQITPASLSKAEKQALLPKHLIQLLRKNAENGLPPQLYKAIKAWETEGKQAAIQTETILRRASPEILQALRDSKASHWLGESLEPSDVILKKGGEKAITQALANLGYLTDINESENENA